MTAPPKTRYAKGTGDVHIAYQVVGEGPVDLVFIQGFVSNVDYWWEMPVAARLLNRLASFSRLILWDKRGTGLSDPVDRVPTLDERVEDLRAVMQAVGSERTALYGISEGGPMALLFAAAHPEQTSALILYGSSPKFSQAPDWPWGWTAEEVHGWLEEIDRDWADGAMFDLFAPGYAHIEAARQSWGRYLRAGASPKMGRAVIQALAALDCRDILPAVRVPTLIIHRSGDKVAKVEAARYMEQHVPGAKMVELPGDDHPYTLGDQDSIIDEIEEFLTGIRHTAQPDRVLATVLFTDIVDSTNRAAELGDRRWLQLLDSHDRLVRQQLDRVAGKEIKRTGDGFLATFTGPSRAIECACAIRDGVGQLGIEIRAGLHTGECELVPGDIGGLAVHIAARVVTLAGPGEVLVSNTVKDLVVGADLEFDERGLQALKGVPGEWRLFAVKS
jgi:pimeloyl-ACP methyl ester carboxylesterase